MKKVVSKPSPLHARRVASAGDIAEYHAQTGVDDLQIRNLLEKKGLVVLEQSRYALGRTSTARSINRIFSLAEGFKICAQRAA